MLSNNDKLKPDPADLTQPPGPLGSPTVLVGMTGRKQHTTITEVTASAGRAKFQMPPGNMRKLFFEGSKGRLHLL